MSSWEFFQSRTVKAAKVHRLEHPRPCTSRPGPRRSPSQGDRDVNNLKELLARVKGATALHDKMADSHPSLRRGQVWCRSCGSTRRVDSAAALHLGWPKCCGSTMTIDSPEEQAALVADAGPSSLRAQEPYAPGSDVEQSSQQGQGE